TDKQWLLKFMRNVHQGIEPEEVARMTFAGIRENKFYIFTHPEFSEHMQQRFARIVQQGDPLALEF
ncbi:MAG: hypothetical protein AAGG80_03365, partial [Pseudomonadota bacterium]